MKLPQKYAYLLSWSASTRRKSATSGFGRTSDFFLRKKSGSSEKISVVVTVKNDNSGVSRLLADLKKQTVRPDEVIVIRSEEYGNCTRGRGRNIGIRKARNDFIVVTDVGCKPRRKWLEKIDGQMVRMAEMAKKVRKAKKAEGLKGQAVVVAGWYRAVAKTPWQKAFLPYLVPKIKKDMKNKREKKGEGKTFLPASRSIAFTKKAWELVAGYPEEAVSGGEDLKFADKLCNHPGIKIIYSPKAVVDWPVPATLGEFIKDMVKHTRGNFEAGYWPHIFRNLSVVTRWIVMAVWPWMIIIYFGLEIKKKIKIIKSIKIIMIILAVRVIADAAVVYGVIIGIIDGWVIKRLRLPALGG